MLESYQLGGRRCSVHLHIYVAKDSGIGTLQEKGKPAWSPIRDGE